MKKLLSIIAVSALFVPTTFASQSYSEGYYFAKVTANIRAQAGMQGQKIGHVEADDELYVRGQKGAWCDVEYRTYEHAYVLCSLLEAETYDTTPSGDYSYPDSSSPDSVLPQPEFNDLPTADTTPWSMPEMQPKACDPKTSTCSGDFKVGITADLHNSSSHESVHDIKLNLHGQGRVNIKDPISPEASFNLNGSVKTDMGAGQGSVELVMKDKVYARLNDLQLANIPGMPSTVNTEIQQQLGQWFVLPTGEIPMHNSAALFMPHGGLSGAEVNSLISISKFIGKDINGASSRYHYQVILDDQKIAQMLGSDVITHDSNSVITANYWLDDNQRIVSANVLLKIAANDNDTVTGSISINFDSSNLNQDIHVTAPDHAAPLPQSLTRGQDVMML